MVVHMKERKLTPFLSEDDENGVCEVKDLGDVEEPEKGAKGGVGRIKGLTRQQSIVLYQSCKCLKYVYKIEFLL